jgi:hypothetical protein
MADEFPRTRIENLSVSRLLIGTNWFLGWSHTTAAADRYIQTRVTEQDAADIIEVFLRAGADTIVGFAHHPKMMAAIKRAEDKVGRKVIIMSTPGLDLAGTPEAEANNARLFDEEAQMGVAICMPHQSTTDALCCRLTRTIRHMDTYCRMIRQRGMIPGLSTHMPEVPVYADQTNLDVGTYIQIYNAAGFLMQIEVEWVQRVIQGLKKPVVTIKPMAAGRLTPLVGLSYAWATIRDIDMVAVGTMSADEARECIEISLAQLSKQAQTFPLQRTRSKKSIDGK